MDTAAVDWDGVGAHSPGSQSPEPGRAGGQGLVDPGSQEPLAHLESHKVSQVLPLQLLCPYVGFVP